MRELRYLYYIYNEVFFSNVNRSFYSADKGVLNLASEGDFRTDYD